MTILFLILIILASFILGLVVLVQNPKGGGLAGTFGGLGNQFMGVKQTTDVLEKGTWIFAAVIALLSLASAFFIAPSQGGANDTKFEGSSVPVGTQPQQNQNSTPFPPAPGQPNQ